jgi:hypothetical protein
MKTRPIPFAPGYFVREDGAVFSERQGARKRLKTGSDAFGYANHGLMINKRVRTMRVHVIVAFVFLGPKPSALHGVRHKNGDHTNNHYKNLAWGTQQENIDDRERHGRTARGKRNGAHTHPEKVRRGEEASAARLTVKDVVVIRRRLANGELGICLAREFGVAKTTISAIKNGHTWRSS